MKDNFAPASSKAVSVGNWIWTISEADGVNMLVVFDIVFQQEDRVVVAGGAGVPVIVRHHLRNLDDLERQRLFPFKIVAQLPFAYFDGNIGCVSSEIARRSCN